MLRRRGLGTKAKCICSHEWDVMGIQVDCPRKISEALKKALASDRPNMVGVVTDGASKAQVLVQ